MADEAPEEVPEPAQQDETVPEEDPVEEVQEVAPVVKEQYRLELPRPQPTRRVRADIALRRIIHQTCSKLPELCSQEEWTSVRRCMQLLLWWCQQVPGAADYFVSAKGASRVQGVVRAAAGGAQALDVGVRGALLEAGAGLLLVAVRGSEAAADLVVESETIRLLLGLLRHPSASAATKRATTEVLAALAASKLVYKDVLQGAGVLEPLLACLTDAACLADLVLTQQLLWLLICLADDDVVYKDHMREEGVPAALVALLAAYQTQSSGVPELRPIAAQACRALRLLSHDDDQIKDQVRDLGLVQLLVGQIRHDVAVLAQPSGPVLCTTPDRPERALGGGGAGSGSSTPGRSPRTSFNLNAGGGAWGGRSGGAGGLLARELAGEGGLLARDGSSNLAAAVIPEDAEGVVAGPAASPYAHATGHFSTLSRNISFQARHVEAGALRGAAGGPAPLTRLCTALLVREAAAGAGVGAGTAQVLVHATLLPVLHMQLVPPRLSLALEATTCLKGLLVGSPANQAAAAAAGAVTPLVKLLYARNLDLASQAAESITHMAACQADWVEAGAVPALAELLSECATHAQGVGLSQRDRTHTGVTGDDALGPRGSAVVQWGAEGGAGGKGTLVGRQQRVRVSVQASGHCLVCNAFGHESCGFCPLSQVVKALLRVMTTDAATQHSFLVAGGLPLLFGLLRQEAGQQHSRLLASCAALLALAVVNNPVAQEVVRGCGGLEVLGGCLAALGSLQAVSGDVYQLRARCVAALTVSLKDNHANKITAREQGVLGPMVGLLRGLVEAAGAGAGGGLGEVEGGEQLLGAVLELVAAAAEDSPGNQDVLYHAGAVHLLIQTLMSPTAAANTALQRVTAAALGRLVDGHPAASAVAATSCVPLWLLQQIWSPSSAQALQVYSQALPRVLRGCPAACQQVLEAKAVQCLVQLLGSCSDRAVLIAVAQAMEVLARQDRVVASQLVTAGAVIVLLSLLSPGGPTSLSRLSSGHPAANPSPPPPPPPPPAAAADGEQVPSASSHSSTAAAAAGGASSNGVTQYGTGRLAAAASNGDSSSSSAEGGAAQQPVLEEHPAGATAAAIFAAVEGARPLSLAPIRTSSNMYGSSPVPASAWEAAVAAAVTGVAAAAAAAAGGGSSGVSLFQVQVACLHTLMVLAHDNTFTKNAARQAGVFPTLGDLLAALSPALEASTLLHTKAAQAAAAATSGGDRGRASRPGSRGRLLGVEGYGSSGGARGHVSQRDLSSSPRGSVGGGSFSVVTAAAAGDRESSLVDSQIQEQIGVMTAAVAFLGELCRGNHPNQDACAGEGLLPKLAGLLALGIGEGLGTAALHAGVLAAGAGAVGAAAEFHPGNKVLCREAGVLDVLSRLILMVAEAPDVATLLHSHHPLQCAVAACLSAVAVLAQDCEEDQRSFLDSAAFLPALWRLMSVPEPGVAAAAAKALEFIAIRTDIRDDADDRSEFESDTIQTLVKLLSKGAVGAGGVVNIGALTSSGGAAAAGGGGSQGPTAAAVKEASVILAAVVEASDPEAVASSSSKGGGPTAIGTQKSMKMSLGGATSAPMGGEGGKGRPPLSNQGSRKGLSTAGSAPPPPASAFQAAAGGGEVAGGGGVGVGLTGSSDLLQAPAALLPAVVTDHSSGLAVLRTWSVQADPSEFWRGLVGRAAPLFPGVAAAVPPGPWAPFHEQLAWVLLMLALKASTNRQLMARMQRATLAPLASQLEAAEKYAAAAEAAAAAAAEARGGEGEGGQGGDGSRRASRGSSSAGGAREGGPPPTAAAAAAGEGGAGLPVTGGDAPPHTPAAAAAAAGAAGSAGATAAPGGVGTNTSSSSSVSGGVAPRVTYRSGAPPGASHVLEEDTDEFAMLQQEVAFLQLQGSLQHPQH